MLPSEDVSSRLSTVKRRLGKVGIRWVVFAGAAAYCYGSRRQITDVDILVQTEDLKKAKSVLGDVEGFDVFAGATIRTEQGFYPFFLDDEMIARINRRKLFNVEVPVISVEDNIVFKAIVQRGQDEGKHDIEDIEDMTANESVNLKYLQERIEKCRAEKRVKPLLQQLGILKQ